MTRMSDDVCLHGNCTALYVLTDMGRTETMKLKKGVTARKEGEQMVLVVAPQSSKSTEALRAEHVNGHARKTYHIAGKTTQTKGENDKMERRFFDESQSSVCPQDEADVYKRLVPGGLLLIPRRADPSCDRHFVHRRFHPGFPKADA